VSGICVNRKLAVKHYQKRLKYISKKGYKQTPNRSSPRWARIMGYEPGKSVTAGGFTYEKIDDWKSEYPNIDIRHRECVTASQMTLDRFRRKPENFVSVTVDKVPGWNLKKMFNLKS
jgi:hypothetical protein